jgi:hypothetical protein
LRFKVYGLNNDQSITLSLDTDDYELDSSKPLEIDYTYQKYTEDLIKFSIYDENITNNILIEITVASQSNDYTQIEFSANMDPITIQNEKGKIIKIPKDFNDDLLNYFIVFPKNTIAQVEISYDDINYYFSKYYLKNNYECCISLRYMQDINSFIRRMLIHYVRLIKLNDKLNLVFCKYPKGNFKRISGRESDLRHK